MADPYEHWGAGEIAHASDCPRSAVETHWPKLVEALARCGINTPNVQLGVIGTTAIESASHFAPVREGCYLGEPEPAESHRLTLPYYPYYGRGEIQLTHEGNYKRYGPKVAGLWGIDPNDPNFDLLNNPDQALDPNIAATVTALYFRDTRAQPSASYPEGYTLVQACEAQDWEWVRRLVYGGSDPAGSQRIEQIAAELGPPGGAAVSDLPVYNSAYPAISQNDSWSCSPTSMRWALSSWGRNPSEQWVENSMISEGVVSMNQGLLNASGLELARWVTRHYQEFGFQGDNDGNVSFDDVAAEAVVLKHPLCLGGRGWYHWTGCRGFDGSKILLANPAPSYKGVSQTLSREQFEYLGPFSLVRVMHPAAEAEVPVPPVDPGDPYAPWAGKVGSGILEMMKADGGVLPAQRQSTWLPLGVTPSDVETCVGANGCYYYWLLTTGHGYRQQASW